MKAAHDYIARQGASIVIKADGLAAGKGVVVAMTVEEAYAAVGMMLSDNKLGDAGARVVIEEFLDGEEASFIVMVDGKNILPFLGKLHGNEKAKFKSASNKIASKLAPVLGFAQFLANITGQ